MITNFDQLVDVVKKRPKKTIAVAMAEESDALAAVSHASREGIADAVLVGNKEKIKEISDKHEIEISNFDVIPADSENQSVVIAKQLVRERLADALMKGKCSTATLLKAVLDKKQGVRSPNQLLSHFAVFQVSLYPKLLFMTDGGMNIAPDLNTKIAIIENAIEAVRCFDIEKPKVALIAAIEKVNHDSMPCTVDYAVISKMAQRGQIKGAIVDGPLALDNAISPKSCKVKGINSPIDGEADILIMPAIEAGNVFYKALNYLTESRTAGVILGAKVPIILTSRADDQDTKFLSIAVAMITSQRA